MRKPLVGRSAAAIYGDQRADPHTINGVKTFEFLHKHLAWPVTPAARK
jgi:hypothetical protein